MNEKANRNQTRQPGTTSPSVSGVLETIAAGLSLAIARPYLLIMPLFVDLMIWLGIQISARSLLDPLQSLMLEQGGENGPAAAEQLSVMNERFHVNDMAALFTPSIFAGLPRDSLLNGLVSFLVPPIAGGIDRGDMFMAWRDGLFSLWEPATSWSVLGVMVVAFAVATVLLVIYRVPIARSVREHDRAQRGVVVECLIAWLRLVAILVLAAGAMAAVIAPALLGTAILLVLGLNIAGLLAVALLIFGGLASIYTLFTLDAMFLERIGPLTSITHSFDVVRANFGSTMRFAFASLIIATGSLQVWSVITQNAPGVIIALFGNALLGTGLSIASMMFFHDRSRALAVSVASRNPRTTRPGWLR